ncbi:reverse transcriptase [Elysia marginata]|uniref:Reverse transcriptase n=1 Tax=Elysia marginata TaxID=1093978 RepID=A0AAV4IVT2_9GAST|nr:reverse transcriptase [Elysia marginata]
MLKDSDNPVVKTVQPSIKTDRKWKVSEAIDEAKQCLKMNEENQIKARHCDPFTFNTTVHHGGTCCTIYESRMEQAKKEKYLDLTKELGESGYRVKIMPIEIGVREFAGSSAYNLLSNSQSVATNEPKP